MKLFISDLDNTLIYSYKKELGEGKILVERMGEKALSYMTEKSYYLLDSIRAKYCFIPLTTRSIEQYRRIRLSKNETPEFALTSNGGNLLYKDRVEEEWYRDSLRLIEDTQEELSKAESVLKKDENVTFEIRRVDGLFVFTKSCAPLDTVRNLESELNSDKVLIFSQGVKVYVMPVSLNKGTAAERIKSLTGGTFLICAGDSAFDIPMLEKADLAFCPTGLADSGLKNRRNTIVIPEEIIFSDGILEEISRFK